MVQIQDRRLAGWLGWLRAKVFLAANEKLRATRGEGKYQLSITELRRLVLLSVPSGKEGTAGNGKWSSTPRWMRNDRTNTHKQTITR